MEEYKMQIRKVRFNHIVKPLGFHMDRVDVSWKTDDAAGRKQTAARIVIAADPKMQDVLSDTGFSADVSSLGTVVPLELRPRTRYYCQVAVRSDAGEEAASNIEWFETGKMDEPWMAKWIGCDSTEPRHPYFEKDIKPSKAVRSARLYITGLGLYEAYYNGEKIGCEYLAPFSNNYNAWVQVQTYDVTEALQKQGKLSLLLGNGWYKARFGFTALENIGYYGNEWKLLCELHLTYADGTEDVIGTDESWTVRRSNIIFSNLYDGEQVDDTLAPLPEVPCTLVEAPKGTLQDRLSTCLTVHETMKPAALIHTPAGEQVLDMGQEITGVFELKVHEPKGTKIHIQTGEILQKGCFYNENLRSAKSEYIYISDGTEKVLHPLFTYYGYRFVKVEGVPDLKKEDFTGLCIYSDVEQRSDMKTGHELVNKLLSNVRWGLKDNFLDVPTDCPQRDERMGWTADTQVFTATASYLSDSYAFYAKFLHDMETEQAEHDGMVPDVIPSAGVHSTSSVWGDASCIIPWTLYEFYGDKAILEDQFDSMKAWVDWIRRYDGSDHAWRKHFSYGDWLALDAMGDDPEHAMGGTDEGFISNIYYAASADLVCRAAHVLGKQEEEKEYRRLSEEQFDAVKEEYYSPTGRCCIRTQTAMILTLKYHLSSNEQVIKDTLRDLFNESDHKLRTGFTGTPLLGNVLTENGFPDLAFELLLNEEFPGWLNEIKLGATTVWERWNSILADGTISGTSMNSMNHYSYGSIVEWMYRHVAGINDAAGDTGFRHALLEPLYNWDLKEVHAEYDSAAGLYKSAWKILDENHVHVSVTVPFNCTADLKLEKAEPDVFTDRSNPMFADVENGICHLQAGTYEVTYKTDRPLKNGWNVDLPCLRIIRNPEMAKYMYSFSDFRTLPVEMRGKSFRDFLNKNKPGLTEKDIIEINRKLTEIAERS
jgi:alpha-L-rhamnosidase